MLTPVIEVISDKTMEYKTTKAKDVQVGGFDFNLGFRWHVVPEADLKNRSSPVAPVRYVLMLWYIVCFCGEFYIFTSLAKEVMFLVAYVGLPVCLFVDNITQIVMNGLG